MLNPIFIAYLGFALLGFTAGCVSTTCTEIGCRTGFLAELTGTNADFPPGAYRVDVTADGVVKTCTFTLTAARTVGVSASCDEGLRVAVAFGTGDWVHESIDTYDATPVEIRVQQSRDGVTTLDRTERPFYETARPNGPDCDPTCRSAYARWLSPFAG
jgi:hypothetical protein